MKLIKLFSVLTTISGIAVLSFTTTCRGQMIKILPPASDSVIAFGNFVGIENNLINIQIGGLDDFITESYIYKIKEFENNPVLVSKIPYDLDERFAGWHHYSFQGSSLINKGLISFHFIDTTAGFKIYRPSDDFSVYHQYIPILSWNSGQGSGSDGLCNFGACYPYFHVRYTQTDAMQRLNLVDKLFKKENDNWVLSDSVSRLIPYEEANLSAYSIKSVLSADHVMTANYWDSKYGKKNGMVDIYSITDGQLQLSQKIYHPDPYVGNSFFGVDLDVTADGRFLAIGAERDATGTKKGAIYIYEWQDDGSYQLFQTITESENDPKLEFGYAVCIFKNDLLIGNYDIANNTSRGEIIYYRFNGSIFEKICVISPPAADVNYGSFGISIDQSGEFVVAGAQEDDTYYKYNGAAYVFRIPARSTVIDTICEGDTYFFNDTSIVSSGNYTDTLVSSYCVDSIVHLDLVVLPNTASIIDTTLCEGEILTIGDSIMDQSGNYLINLQSRYGCDSVISINLEYSMLHVDVNISPDYGCENGSIELLLEGNSPPYNISWSDGNKGEILESLSAGIYHVVIKDKANCQYTINEIVVGEELPFQLPNAFVPNSSLEDNRRFKPYIPEELTKRVEIKDLQIFNRWGEKVYAGDDVEGWDGTFKGANCPPGSYLYILEINTPCGSSVKRGNMILIK